MKKLRRAFIISLLFFASCKNTGSGDPKTVIINFFEALSKKDVSAAKKLATKSSQDLLGMMEMGMKMGEDKSDTKFDIKNMEFGEPKIDGDKATISVKQKSRNESIDFILKKEDGSWKVAFDKEMLQNEMGKQMGKMKNGIDKEMRKIEGDNNDSDDKKTNSAINLENYGKIKTGMPYDDIVRIFGDDKGRQTGGGVMEDKQTIIFVWGDSFDKNIEVTFDKTDSTVLAKEKEGF